MENTIRYKGLQWLIYPLTMIITVCLFFIFLHADSKLMLATYLPLLFAVIVILSGEIFLPFNKSWKPVASDWKNDTLFLVAVQILLPKILRLSNRNLRRSFYYENISIKKANRLYSEFTLTKKS